MRPYILAESNWKDIKEQKVDLVILPWGATEAHNYHLPYATDNIQVDHIAAEAAGKAWNKGARILVLPCIPFGVNTGQTDIRLNINMNPSTQAAVLNDVIEVLNRQKIDKLLVLNGHGGNDFKTMIRELGVRYPEMLLASCSWFKSLDKSRYFENEGDHADEMETSLMLYLAKELVRPLEEAGDGKEKKFKINAFRENWAWAERKWSQVTKDTGVGNPYSSTKEKGEAYFKDVTDKLAELFTELAGADPADMFD
ncbi:MAG: creatininase family protein [Balneolaceae bacterium]